jgi:hypothetical protein
MRLVVLMDANEQQKLERGTSPRLVETIDAADRKIHNYLLRQHLSAWHPISTAPANNDLELRVLNKATVAILPFPCRRTNSGKWINADLGTSIDVQPVKWRPWQKPKASRT